MTNSKQAIREFAEKWGIKQNDEPTFDPHTENLYYGYTHCVKQCLSDLTALISEGYYPKEFTEWVSGTGWQYHMKFKIWTLGMTKATTDELYEVWKENER